MITSEMKFVRNLHPLFLAASLLAVGCVIIMTRYIVEKIDF